MTNWMRALSVHHDKTRSRCPDGKLMIIFDIDNTIVDMRYMIAFVLKAYDKRFGTTHFADLEPTALTINENQVDELLEAYSIPAAERRQIVDWYLEKRWSPTAIMESHRPYAGVMEVIRWFQMQPKTFVGLNTGRPESIRADTLRSLNALGAQYKVRFESELLHMNPGNWGDDVRSSKVDGVRKYQKMGYHIFAVVDNEPENLNMIAQIDVEGAMLMLHADTIFDSQRARLPRESVSGVKYDLTELIPEAALPSHIQFVWHGVNEEPNLLQFLASNVQWAECDVRLDEAGEQVVLRHASFERAPRRPKEELFELKEMLLLIKETEKSIKVDIKEAQAIDGMTRQIKETGLRNIDLWINGSTVDLDEATFRRFAGEFPGATIQCPVGFLSRLVLEDPEAAREKLERFRSWGINRFSIAWGVKGLARVLQQLDEWGYDVNIYNVTSLASFLKAILLQPRSVTSDFNFPKWHYYGRGAEAEHTYASPTISRPRKPRG